MLVERNFVVAVPDMPNTNEPRIKDWVSNLAKVVGKPDKDTYFVGHSIGCQTILRYLEGINENVVVGGAVFIAGWFHLIKNSLETKEEEEIANEWTDTPINFESVRKHLKTSTACFSDNDPFVSISESKVFEKELGSKIIIHPKRGHFRLEDGISELHVALNEVLKMARD